MASWSIWSILSKVWVMVRNAGNAESFGLSGVPAIVIRAAGAPWQQAVLVSGAQPYEVLRSAVEQVRARRG